MYKLDLEKAEEPEIKLPTYVGSSKKARVPEKHLPLLYWLCQSLWLCGSKQTVENSSKDVNIRPSDLPPKKTFLQVKKQLLELDMEKIDWFQIREGVHQGYILSPCLFNFYTEYIIQNAGMDKAQAGIKIAGGNINNIRYADDTTLIAENKEELKSLLMKVK